MKENSQLAFMLERQKGIGGSDVAPILGMSKFKTAYDVYLDKIKTPEEVEDEELTAQKNELFYWGHALESAIIDKLAEKLNVKIKVNNKTKISNKFDCFRANVDGLILDKNKKPIAICEAKNVNAFAQKEWGDEETDNLPDYYLLQLQWYMMIYDVDKAYLGALFGGNKFKMYSIERNKKLDAIITEKALSFWNENVLKRKAPELSFKDDVAKIYPQSTDGVIIATEEDLNIYEDLIELKESSKAINDEIKTLEQKLKLRLADNGDTLTDVNNNKLCTYKSQISKRLNTTALKKEQAEIYNKYLVDSQTRVLRLSSKRGE